MFKDEVIHKMTMKMLDKYDKYWGVVHEIMGVTSILDPRYKMSLVEFYFDQVFEKEEALKYLKITFQIQKMLKIVRDNQLSSQSLIMMIVLYFLLFKVKRKLK